ncbi:hypothetical protein B0O99DRAFT_691262 [Bisporella sp. PMI_857]|nr:hypothetical protein B0O99DRAFT_691262 [Bisporella sp. PMI_857]
MASRSFKPASFLASAQSPKIKPSRPGFTRTSSSSSTKSTNSAQSSQSDDSFILTLKSLVITKQTSDISFLGSSGSAGGASPSTTGTTSQPPAFDDTPGRKRSLPIPIDLPTHEQRVYTPLSARGDLPGGYFPNHEPIIKPYCTHPFSKTSSDLRIETSQSTSYSVSFSSISSTSVTFKENEPMSANSTPRVIQHTADMGELPIQMPMGKYHPSNYKLSSPSLSPPVAFNSQTSGIANMPAASGNLRLPTGRDMKRNKRDQSSTGGHERQPSDVKRKLQQYQRDMIAQARLTQTQGAGSAMSSSHCGTNTEGTPFNPKLQPLGSPGPITPFELEEEQDGYLVAGGTRDGGSSGGILGDERRRMEGSRSPIVRV